MQIFKRSEYKTLSDKNRIRVLSIPPKRGQIYDRNGEIIATNKACFRLLVDKASGNDYKKDLVLISAILKLPEELDKSIFSKVSRARSSIPVLILDQLTWEQIAAVEERKSDLPSIFIDMGYMRYYPAHVATAHLLGYTGQITASERLSLNVTEKSDCYVGKAGIEKYYEEHLQGKFGYKELEVNAYGKPLRTLGALDATQGLDLQLNIDVKLHSEIYPYLNEQGCSVLVMDCRNGDIIINSSTPAYDPNNFYRLSTGYWKSLLNSPYKPLLNKVVQNTYPPGSIFKLITILAALESGVSTNHIVNCTGNSALGINGFRCWRKGGHGRLDMSQGIKHSCNAYMYDIIRIIGPDIVLEMAKRFGFGAQTGVDLPNELSGFVPSKLWKIQTFGHKWTLGDSLNISIGQGALLVTPIQLVRFAAAIATGKLFIPTLVSGSNKGFIPIKVNSEHVEFIKDAMYQVVNTIGGTAYGSRLASNEFALAGKTGTSQVKAKASANDDLSKSSVAWERRNHASFIGFAPFDNPQYAISVIVDHGGGGASSAAPIANKVMKALFKLA